MTSGIRWLVWENRRNFAAGMSGGNRLVLTKWGIRAAVICDGRPRRPLKCKEVRRKRIARTSSPTANGRCAVPDMTSKRCERLFQLIQTMCAISPQRAATHSDNWAKISPKFVTGHAGLISRALRNAVSKPGEMNNSHRRELMAKVNSFNRMTPRSYLQAASADSKLREFVIPGRSADLERQAAVPGLRHSFCHSGCRQPIRSRTE